MCPETARVVAEKDKAPRFAFGFLGEHYLDRRAAGLIISALIPLAFWPPVHYFMNRPPRQPAGIPAAPPAPPGGSTS